jgi:bifunctional non-homologous end joining protein LigD
MLATLTKVPFSHRDWLFEPKLDGVRALAELRGGHARLVSRRGTDMTATYPALAAAVGRQPVREAVLDGEIVALDDRGRPSFQLLQRRLGLVGAEDIRRADRTIPVVYYVFDILYLDGHDLTAVPLEERRRLLRAALAPNETVRLVEPYSEDGEAAFRRAIEEGLEGVVAKRRGSRYEPGARSGAWLKVKGTTTDEFVIGGYTEGLRARAPTFGALLLGQYDEAGRLGYAGHVGTGFDRLTLHELKRRLDALRTERAPFAEEPALRVPVTWVRPELVAEVRFVEWTRDRRLRAPSFLRLREDKAPRDVKRAAVADAPR